MDEGQLLFNRGFYFHCRLLAAIDKKSPEHRCPACSADLPFYLYSCFQRNNALVEILFFKRTPKPWRMATLNLREVYKIDSQIFFGKFFYALAWVRNGFRVPKLSFLL